MKLTRIHYEIIKFIIVGGINTYNTLIFVKGVTCELYG